MDTLKPELVVAGEVVIRRIYNLSVMVDGKKRTFMMTVPEAYKTQTEPEGVFSLYPDGTSMKEPKSIQVMNMPGWNVGPCCSNDNDVNFSREMIAAVEEVRDDTASVGE